MFPAFEALLEGALDRAVACGDLPIADRPACRVEPPVDAAFGDATTRVAMMVARRLGRPAADVARTVAAHVVDPRGWLARVEAAGPGFVNIEASLECWRAALAAQLAGAAPVSVVELVDRPGSEPETGKKKPARRRDAGAKAASGGKASGGSKASGGKKRAAAG